MRMVARAIMPALLVTLIVTTIASADTIYSYTGDYFAPRPYSSSTLSGVYTTADRITGSFTVGDSFVPLLTQGGSAFTPGVVMYSFTDGHQTLINANSTGTFYLTYGNPNLTDMWSVDIRTATSWITSSLYYERHDYAGLDADNHGSNGGCFFDGCDGSHLGTWTVSVPEPATLVLAAAGLLAVGGSLWKRRHTI